MMTFDLQNVWDGVLAFYLSLNVVAALAGTVPGALVEKKNCATLERFHFLLFFFGGAALIGYLRFEITRAMVPDDIWIADLSIAFAAGLYLGNVMARRLRNIAKQPILGLLMWVPLVNIAFMIALAAIPTAPKKDREAAKLT